MLSTLLAVSWEPEIRGIIVVLISVVVLIGGTYLIVGTNLGARLGVLVVLAGFFGWMMTMGAIWWTYGIGLKGPEPSWKPAEPITIIRDATALVGAEILQVNPALDQNPVSMARNVSEQLIGEGWRLLEESDPQRGQAVAASDAIIQVEAEEFAAGEYLSVAVYDRGGERYPKINESLDFIAFFHKPRYALVEVAPVIPQRTEPGRAPARPVIDEAQPHRYVYMIRDLGAKRQPAILITFGSAIIFVILCWLLHRRDLMLRENVSGERMPARA
ncbi:MAG: hypothetical protein ACO33B_04060 [Ilumatobacteraceae bacterium]